jgi:DMSO/TMAO reductase YedYZ molybdopterin-dependent catalytic subunit
MDGNGAPVGRRVVLGMLALGAVGVVGGRTAQSAIDSVRATVSNHDPTGLSALVPAAGGFRYYSVTGDVPHIADADYRVTVSGLVSHPLNLSLAELRALPRTSLTRDFQCVTGWRVPNVKWSGVALSHLLETAGVKPGAAGVSVRSHDGVYTESLSLDEARRPDVIVALEMEGKAVTRAHGGPARLYVAPMYGYKSCKWLADIEVTDQVRTGYWEQYGYAAEAWVGNSNGRDDAPTG